MIFPSDYPFYEPYYAKGVPSTDGINHFSITSYSYPQISVTSIAVAENYYLDSTAYYNAYLDCIATTGFLGIPIILDGVNNHNIIVSNLLQYAPCVWLRDNNSIYAEYLFGVLALTLGFSNDFMDLNFPDVIQKYTSSNFLRDGSSVIGLSTVYEVESYLLAGSHDIPPYNPFSYINSLDHPIPSVLQAIDYMKNILDFLGVSYNATI
jgi:hypothetical protein